MAMKPTAPADHHGHMTEINIPEGSAARYNPGWLQDREGKWRHVAVTFDDDNQPVFYLDGEKWRTR